MQDLIIFGLPGSGKGTQTKLLIDYYNMDFICTGDLLRSVSAGGSVYSAVVADFIKKGELVTDELVCELVKERLLSLRSGVAVVFDGFPRSFKQAYFLSSLSRDIAVVIELVVDEGLVVDRLKTRLLCTKCFCVTNSRHSSFVGVCQSCGSSDLVIRNDDADILAVKKRISEYKEQLCILKSYYDSKIVKVDGSRSVAEVWEGVKGSVDLFVNSC